MTNKNDLIDVNQEELFEELHDKFDALLNVLIKKEMLSEAEFLKELNILNEKNEN